MPCCLFLIAESKGSRILQNISKFLPDYLTGKSSFPVHVMDPSVSLLFFKVTEISWNVCTSQCRCELLINRTYFTFFCFCVCIFSNYKEKSYKINLFLSIDRGLCHGSGSQLSVCHREGPVLPQGSHYSIYGGHSGTGTGFYACTFFVRMSIIPPMLHILAFIYANATQS